MMHSIAKAAVRAAAFHGDVDRARKLASDEGVDTVEIERALIARAMGFDCPCRACTRQSLAVGCAS